MKTDKEDILIILPFAFPICMAWLGAWLHINIQFEVWDSIWGHYGTVGFITTPYGFAFIITVVMIEIILWLCLERTR